MSLVPAGDCASWGNPLSGYCRFCQSHSKSEAGIAILSYADDLVFGITADYDAASDVDELATGIERAAARLTKRASNDARLASDG